MGKETALILIYLIMTITSTVIIYLIIKKKLKI